LRGSWTFGIRCRDEFSGWRRIPCASRAGGYCSRIAHRHSARPVGLFRAHDSELTADGRRAASCIAGALRDQIPDRAEVELFSSDLRRTRQTAEEVAQLFAVDPILDRRLREKSYGEAEGRPHQWLDMRFLPPPAVGERLAHDEGVKGAETRGAWVHRVYAAMKDILQRPCEHQIVVTHAGTLTPVVAAWIKMPIGSTGYASFRVPSGSITTLHEDDFYHNRTVARLGDDRHLGTAGSA
jgi:2,3-bisphosphoglycerate-dependent phosphoglycerate mutase